MIRCKIAIQIKLKGKQKKKIIRYKDIVEEIEINNLFSMISVDVDHTYKGKSLTSLPSSELFWQYWISKSKYFIKLDANFRNKYYKIKQTTTCKTRWISTLLTRMNNVIHFRHGTLNRHTYANRNRHSIVSGQ